MDNVADLGVRGSNPPGLENRKKTLAWFIADKGFFLLKR